MADLEVTFQCLCLFVPGNSVMHVLMPATAHHNQHHHEPPHEHQVRLRNANLCDPRMEGWVLALGDRRDPADTTFNPTIPSATRAEIAYISDDFCKVPPASINNLSKVAARVELRSGRFKRFSAEARFHFRGRVVRMANRVTWEIKGIPDYAIAWDWLGSGTNGDPPFRTLADLGEVSGRRKLDIFHVNQWPLRAGGRTLNADDLRQHFRSFYEVCEYPDPDEDHLPTGPVRIKSPYRVPNFACVAASAVFK